VTGDNDSEAYSSTDSVPVPLLPEPEDVFVVNRGVLDLHVCSVGLLDLDVIEVMVEILNCESILVAAVARGTAIRDFKVGLQINGLLGTHH
jgi:hypothetical protein